MSSKLAPCQGCGGPKTPGVRGSRYCDACRETKRPVWEAQEKERGRRKNAKTRRELGMKLRVRRVREDDGHIWCGRCLQYMHPSRFTKAPSTKVGYAAYCKICARSYNHERRMKVQFGIDYDYYLRLYDLQDGRCAICRNRPKKTRLAVDHDHRSGVIRGLLCSRCNHDLLGASRDSIEMLERAISYLESPPAQTGVPVLIHEDFVDRGDLPRVDNNKRVDVDMRKHENWEEAS